jgi:hypothetical protein
MHGFLKNHMVLRARAEEVLTHWLLEDSRLWLDRSEPAMLEVRLCRGCGQLGCSCRFGVLGEANIR